MTNALSRYNFLQATSLGWKKGSMERRGAGVRSGGQDERRDQNDASTTTSFVLVGVCKHAKRGCLSAKRSREWRVDGTVSCSKSSRTAHTPHIKTYRVGVDGRQVMQVVEQVVGLLLVDGSRAIERLGHQVRGLDHSGGSSGGRHDDGWSTPAVFLGGVGNGLR